MLVIVNRDNSEAFTAAYNFFESYCPSITEFICGIANKDDEEYDNFNNWLDAGNEKSLIAYLDTEKFEKYIYPGDLSAINAESVNNFVADIKAGKIEAYKGLSDIVIDATTPQ